MTPDIPTRGLALVIVAHPDDEVLWCGGLILSHPNLSWTIVAACRASDPDRRPRFEEACRKLGATGHILDVDDSPELKRIDGASELMVPLEELLSDRTWRLCLTHGENGEYGHRRHIDVHTAVKSLIDEERLACRRFWTFAYTSDEGLGVLSASHANVTFPLAPEIYQCKKGLLEMTYGFAEGSFEQSACLPTESFSIERAN